MPAHRPISLQKACSPHSAWSRARRAASPANLCLPPSRAEEHTACPVCEPLRGRDEERGLAATAEPQRRHAWANRRRILDAARGTLSADPDTTVEDIARAAGVARRTLYGHFATRDALLAALADDAVRTLRQAFPAPVRELAVELLSDGQRPRQPTARIRQ
ncbi:helix-turn-helix domain-containing protein [Streptomyces antibioticus]|uniref:helix-turn-helix domain-containing protein n=1 Tax=Streptomyces antibioticus TaxID=1890 RepID=UPI00339E7292